MILLPNTVKAFWNSLLSGDETVVDSVITAGVVSLLALLGFQCYAAFVAHEPFNAITFCTGASTLCGAMGASKGVRHRLCGDCGLGATPDVRPTDPKQP